MVDIDIKKMSRPKPSGRSSSVTNAFFNGIVPYVAYSSDDFQQIKKNITSNDLITIIDNQFICAYCNENKAVSWDHINPLIKNKKPTGAIHQISNLIPACSKCNSSKGNKTVEEFFETSIIFKNWTSEQLIEGKNRVKNYQSSFARSNDTANNFTEEIIEVDFENLPNKGIQILYNEYCKQLEEIHELLKKSDQYSEKLRTN